MTVQDVDVQNMEVPEVPDSTSPIDEARARVESTVTTATDRIREWQANRSGAGVLPIWLVLGVVVVLVGLFIARRMGESGSDLVSEIVA